MKPSVSHQSLGGNVKGFLLFFVAILAFLAGWYFWSQKSQEVTEIPSVLEEGSVLEEPVQEVLPEPEFVSRPFPSIPFYVQAPEGAWDDPIFQNACEEVSILMVADALAGQHKTVEEQKIRIREIAEWQEEEFGTNVDTDVADTLRTLQEYLGIEHAESVDITKESVIALLEDQKVVIVPSNGQKLENPHFTPPGPETHMLVIFGYDEQTDEFIVQDPGTRFGENYRYKAATLLNAVGEYPTGNHLPTSGALPKKGIAVAHLAEVE